MVLLTLATVETPVYSKSDPLSDTKRLSESSLRNVAARGINDQLQELVDSNFETLEKDNQVRLLRKKDRPIPADMVMNQGFQLFQRFRGRTLTKDTMRFASRGASVMNQNQRTFGPKELLDTTRNLLRTTDRFLETLGKRNRSR